MELKGKSVLVLGLGETGLSLVRWLSAQGARLRVADTRSKPPGLDQVTQLVPISSVHCGPFKDALLQGIELIAISPGVPLYDPLVQRAIGQGIPVAGDIELFALALPEHRRPKIIAITGANGKTTVTSMVGAMCRAAGLDTEVAGNISPAVLDVWLRRQGKQPQVWVLELSSFQLETTQSLHPDAATVLNITEDHLDRYPDMEAYAAAKARIFIGCGVRVLNRDDERSNAMTQAGSACVKFGIRQPQRNGDWSIARDGADLWLVQGQKRVLNANELQVAGLHNIANALAALALCRAIDLPLEPLCAALRAFKGLPHRVERVAEIGGVEYFDDSKGTNVGATEAALNGLGRPAVVILGGEGKGQDFSPLRQSVSEHARAAVLIGRDAGLIEAALQGCGKTVVYAKDMADAVRQSAALARPGDAVLLSPACASFDMFRNYEHRAEVFVAAVKKLQKEMA
ncbi:MAG TPA: UDP-N-acetylmuramoyl-L-alanine--D-glutamate ligase [Gallionellaceae bacterium]